MDHAGGGDDRGTVTIVDLKGAVKHLTTEFASESGMRWSRDGKEIWFTASKEGSNEQPLFAVTPQGQLRMVTAMVGNLVLHDMDANGTVLLTRDSRRREIIMLPPGETRERDMSWFDWSFSRYLSDDGKLLVFEEQGAGGGPAGAGQNRVIQSKQLVYDAALPRWFADGKRILLPAHQQGRSRTAVGPNRIDYYRSNNVASTSGFVARSFTN